MVENEVSKQDKLEATLQASNKNSLGVVNVEFLLQSIGGLLKKLPLCVEQDLTAQQVLELMLAKKAGSALLINEKKQVVGIFTERDYLKQFGMGDKDPKKIKISEVATLNPMTCPPDTTIAYALNLMSHGNFRHLPVVDEQGMALGVISVRDVLDKISELLVQDMLAF